jgi:hypothetical protein
MSKPKKRQKSGKVIGWQIHMLAEYRKNNDDTIYCERAVFSVPIRDQKQISESVEVRDTITQWVKDTEIEGNYNGECHFGIERWQPLRR